MVYCIKISMALFKGVGMCSREATLQVLFLSPYSIGVNSCDKEFALLHTDSYY